MTCILLSSISHSSEDPNKWRISLSTAILTDCRTYPLGQSATQLLLAFEHRKFYDGRDWEYCCTDVWEKPPELPSENSVHFYQDVRCDNADEMVLAVLWFTQLFKSLPSCSVPVRPGGGGRGVTAPVCQYHSTICCICHRCCVSLEADSVIKYNIVWQHRAP
jgi:hypothetical protein